MGLWDLCSAGEKAGYGERTSERERERERENEREALPGKLFHGAEQSGDSAVRVSEAEEQSPNMYVAYTDSTCFKC